jgi:hypothetical protein
MRSKNMLDHCRDDLGWVSADADIIRVHPCWAVVWR